MTDGQEAAAAVGLLLWASWVCVEGITFSFYTPSHCHSCVAVSLFQADTCPFLSHGSEELPHGQPEVHDAAGEL